VGGRLMVRINVERVVLNTDWLFTGRLNNNIHQLNLDFVPGNQWSPAYWSPSV
jgi:hypothetical protein